MVKDFGAKRKIKQNYQIFAEVVAIFVQSGIMKVYEKKKGKFPLLQNTSHPPKDTKEADNGTKFAKLPQAFF